MIVAFLNHKGGVGKTTLALHVAGAWAAQGKRIVVVDTDSQGSALDWSEQRAKEGLTRLFDVLALARDTLHVEAPEIARQVGCEHRPAHERSRVRRSVDHHVIEVTGDLRGFNVESIASELEHIEQPRHPSLGTLFRPVER